MVIINFSTSLEIWRTVKKFIILICTIVILHDYSSLFPLARPGILRHRVPTPQFAKVFSRDEPDIYHSGPTNFLTEKFITVASSWYIEGRHWPICRPLGLSECGTRIIHIECWMFFGMLLFFVWWTALVAALSFAIFLFKWDWNGM